jgi:hypothetical protein
MRHLWEAAKTYIRYSDLGSDTIKNDITVRPRTFCAKGNTRKEQ